MKLTYWIADHLEDHKCYSLRAKTRKACKALVAEAWNKESFGPPRKVVIEYMDAFDLMIEIVGEGSNA